jgi:uncharacterized protein YcgI (DUF1989 family)
VETTFDEVVSPKTGLALEVMKGEHLRVTEIEGKQVVDMAVFNLHDHREKLSTSYSRTRKPPKDSGAYVPADVLCEGDYLLSTSCRPMMLILTETAFPKGVHDSHNRMCNRLLYEMHGIDSRDGCLEILTKTIEPYGLKTDDLPDTLDLFMNYQHDCVGHRWVILEPVTKVGDYIEFRAEMDCLVAMSNCPEDVLTLCNAGQCKSIRVTKYGVDPAL